MNVWLFLQRAEHLVWKSRDREEDIGIVGVEDSVQVIVHLVHLAINLGGLRPFLGE